MNKFLWGASTSGFQVEGGYNLGGKGLSTTDVRHVKEGIADTKVASDHYHHFKEDIGADSPFLNKKQTCNYLGVSNNTLDIWIAMGLPYIRIGKSIRFNKESINQWMTRLEISA